MDLNSPLFQVLSGHQPGFTAVALIAFAAALVVTIGAGLGELTCHRRRAALLSRVEPPS